MIWTPRRLRIRALLAGTGLTLSLACTEAGPPDPHALVAPFESGRFFEAPVTFLAARSPSPTRVDPRPLRPDALLHSVGEDDIVSTDTATIRLRTAVLTAARIPFADAIDDSGCVFAGGMRGPPPDEPGGNDPIWEQMRAAESDTVRARREACRRRGPYTSLSFGPPQEGTEPEHPRWWRIRAMRMMLHGWEIVDLFLEQRTGGGWEVVRVQERAGAFT